MDIDFARRINNNYEVMKNHCRNISFETLLDCGTALERGTVYTFEIDEYQLGNIIISERTDQPIQSTNKKVHGFFINSMKNGIMNKNMTTIGNDSMINNNNREDKKMDKFEVKKVEVINDRVVLMRFWDGTFTKAICTEDDFKAGKFDIDIGITICLIKKMFGETDGRNKAYYKALKGIHRMMEAEEKYKAEEEERIRIAKERKRRKAEKKARKEDKAINGLKKIISDSIIMADEILNNTEKEEE